MSYVCQELPGRAILPNGNFLVVKKSPALGLHVDVETPDGELIQRVTTVQSVCVSDVASLPEEIRADTVTLVSLDQKLRLVKGRFEVLRQKEGSDDFVPVKRFLPETNEAISYFPLREKQEMGMAPNSAGTIELAWTNLYDGYGIQAVLADNEVYVGIQHGLSWWQNLCRIVIRNEFLQFEYFDELTRKHVFDGFIYAKK